MRTAERGFTIQELLTALCLSGVLVSIGVANFAKLLESYNLNSALSQLQTDISTLRSQALSSGCSISITPSQDGSSYSAMTASSCYYGSFEASDRLVLNHKLPPSITVSFTSVVTLSPQGFVVNQSGTPTEIPVLLLRSGVVQKSKTLSTAGVLL